MYYADTTLFRDRLDQYDQNQFTIIDFKSYREYLIEGGKTYSHSMFITHLSLEEICSWSQIPGKITPLLIFPTYDFNGTETYNKTLCYKWFGCHNYEVNN